MNHEVRSEASVKPVVSIVRNNLMTREGYSPYCGGHMPAWQSPRTRFDGQQFACNCGWRSSFEPEFIAEYKAKWSNP
jgi:hypothetical protein